MGEELLELGPEILLGVGASKKWKVVSGKLKIRMHKL
jgi:hypothetical protein|tara:strand:- start:944 stop:1054 length:111 start_codon:yes stop_codon:yes gene_type:complete